jgi:hypothetical protein
MFQTGEMDDFPDMICKQHAISIFEIKIRKWS